MVSDALSAGASTEAFLFGGARREAKSTPTLGKSRSLAGDCRSPAGGARLGRNFALSQPALPRIRNAGTGR